MINEIKQETKARMEKALAALSAAFNKIRTGRANPSILDSVLVPYYGSNLPISQVANIGVEDGRTLSISCWEKQMTPEIEKAILKSDLGLNPMTAGDVIRVPMPMLTEETRRDFIRQARQEAETAKVSVRNARREANNDFKDLLKEKEISEDEERRAMDEVQKLTDKHVAAVDQALKSKEADLLEI